MARRRRPTVGIALTGDERKTLERWARRYSSSQALALRCRIVLACAEGDRTHAEIAAELGCNPVTVSKWRHRFAAERLDGLADAPRTGRGPHNRRRRDGSGHRRNPRDRAARRHALVDSRACGQAWRQPHHGGRDLAGLRAQAVAPGRVQGVARPRPGGKDRDLAALYMNPPVAAAVFDTKSPRSRRSTAPRRPCHAAHHPAPGPPMTTSATAPATVRRPRDRHRPRYH
jgi:transposase-like protein